MSEPVIKLDTQGKASVISYNVPEGTSYSGTNIIELDFPGDWFASKEPTIPVLSDDLNAVVNVPLAINLVGTSGTVVKTLTPSVSTKVRTNR